MSKFRIRNDYYSGSKKTSDAGGLNRLPRRNVVDKQDCFASQSNKSRSIFNRGYNINQNAVMSQIELSERDNLKLLRRRRRRILKALRTITIVFIFLVIFLWFFIARIEIDISNNRINQSSIKDYTHSISQYLNRHPIERLSFNLNQQSLLKDIEQKYPEIEHIELSETGFLKPSHFKILFRKPVATMILNQQRFYVDANGVSFTNNYFDEPKIIIQDQSGLKITDSSRIISSRILSFIGRTIAMLAERNFEVIEVTLPASTIHRFDIRINGFKLYAKFTIDNDSAEQVENLVNGLKYLQQTGTSVEYLDVRVKQKAFYK
ncbi:MAG: hypothetical protein Q3996_01640 [Candidatus Saccharibacteria bacterium]|nr:hypothetical protein [Candidatus Saccharibacteria bacterium]